MRRFCCLFAEADDPWGHSLISRSISVDEAAVTTLLELVSTGLKNMDPRGNIPLVLFPEVPRTFRGSVCEAEGTIDSGISQHKHGYNTGTAWSFFWEASNDGLLPQLLNGSSRSPTFLEKFTAMYLQTLCFILQYDPFHTNIKNYVGYSAAALSNLIQTCGGTTFLVGDPDAGLGEGDRKKHLTGDMHIYTCILNFSLGLWNAY